LNIKTVQSSAWQEDQQKFINTYIREKIKECSEFNFKDDNIWEAFKDEFSHFSEAGFKAIFISVQRGLRL
ncbi:hypothetical protein Golomagni_05090, partial [Golovinomyces magnicellulatus]